MTEAVIEYLLCDVGAVRQACAELSWLNSVLSPDEIAHSNRLRREPDRAGYRSAHLLFRLMAARRLGLEPRDAGELRFTRTCRSCGGPHGKPQLAGAGASAEVKSGAGAGAGAEFSMSRSGTMVLVASAPSSSPIGADVERIPTEVFAGFDDYVLAPAESVPAGEDAMRRRLELWVAKEAAVKTTGHGLAVAPSDIEVDLTGIAPVIAPKHPEIDGLSLAPLPCPPNYVAAMSCTDTLPIVSVGLHELLASRCVTGHSG